MNSLPSPMPRLVLSALCALTSAAALPGVAAAGEYGYVGAKACAECHTSGAGGGAYGVWERSAHARAFTTLKNAKPRKDGSRASETPRCLKCHVTEGGEALNVAGTSRREEGITCEACHGAASAFRTLHADGDRAKSREAGLNPVDPRKACEKCHNGGCDKDFKFSEKWPLIEHGRPERK